MDLGSDVRLVAELTQGPKVVHLNDSQVVILLDALDRIVSGMTKGKWEVELVDEETCEHHDEAEMVFGIKAEGSDEMDHYVVETDSGFYSPRKPDALAIAALANAHRMLREMARDRLLMIEKVRRIQRSPWRVWKVEGHGHSFAKCDWCGTEEHGAPFDHKENGCLYFVWMRFQPVQPKGDGR